MRESRDALTVSATMSAKASRRLPAMLRYQGRRAVAAVGSRAVVISDARVGATIRQFEIWALITLNGSSRRAFAQRKQNGRHVVRRRHPAFEVADLPDQRGQ